jgi:hypothetical protein
VTPEPIDLAGIEVCDLLPDPGFADSIERLADYCEAQHAILRYLRELAIGEHAPYAVSDEVIRLTGGQP